MVRQRKVFFEQNKMPSIDKVIDELRYNTGITSISYELPEISYDDLIEGIEIYSSFDGTDLIFLRIFSEKILYLEIQLINILNQHGAKIDIPKGCLKWVGVKWDDIPKVEQEKMI